MLYRFRMLIDFIKIFPEGCASQKISDLQINIDDITKLDIDLASNPWLEIIHVGSDIYKFPGNEHGVLHIKHIIQSREIKNCFENNKELSFSQEESLTRLMYNNAVKMLDTYKAKGYIVSL